MNTHQQPSSRELEVNNTAEWVYNFNKFLIEERATGEIIDFIQSLLTSHSEAIRERLNNLPVHYIHEGFKESDPVYKREDIILALLTDEV